MTAPLRVTDVVANENGRHPKMTTVRGLTCRSDAVNASATAETSPRDDDEASATWRDTWEPDTRTPEERRIEIAEYRAIYRRMSRFFNPTPQQRHLDTLAFIAAELRRSGATYVNEPQQYLALYQAKREQLGRCPQPMERDDLRMASITVWNARVLTARALAQPVQLVGSES